MIVLCAPERVFSSIPTRSFGISKQIIYQVPNVHERFSRFRPSLGQLYFILVALYTLYSGVILLYDNIPAGFLWVYYTNPGRCPLLMYVLARILRIRELPRWEHGFAFVACPSFPG